MQTSVVVMDQTLDGDDKVRIDILRDKNVQISTQNLQKTYRERTDNLFAQ